MIVFKRLLFAAPFVIAATLTLIINLADCLHLRGEPVAGLAFMFGTPWAWLLDNGIPLFHSRLLNALITNAVVLWIPALLYTACLWGIFRIFEKLRRRIQCTRRNSE